ncbi:MAG: hypothetical protein AB1726_03575 [Planctomycetota bacterium]
MAIGELPPRTGLKGIGALGAASCLGAPGTGSVEIAGLGAEGEPQTDTRRQIRDKVWTTPFIDTHEHLPDERDRLEGTASGLVCCDDWAFLLSHYLDSDLIAAGMLPEDLDRFLSPELDPLDKWPLIAPFWPAVKNTGFGQAVRIAIRELYDVEELSASTVDRVQAGYESFRRAGFYETLLRDRAGIESCPPATCAGWAPERFSCSCTSGIRTTRS